MKNDLDFSGFDWTIEKTANLKSFSSLFNGNDHTISNLTVVGDSADKNVNVFYKVADGTVMNVNFDNVIVWNKNTTKGQVGIIGELQGGYVYDVHMTRVAAKGREGVSALVGIVSGRDNYIDACSLVNPIIYTDELKTYAESNNISNLYAVTKAEDFSNANTGYTYYTKTSNANADNFASYYVLSGTEYVPATSYAEGTDYYASNILPYGVTAYNKYAGGIVGNVQKNSDQKSVSLKVTNCYVNAIIGDGLDAGGCMGGIVGRVKNEYASYTVDVEKCVYEGLILAKGNYNGGMIGSIESAMGNIITMYNYSNVVFMLDGEMLNAYQYATSYSEVKVAHKNCSPIIGRATSSTEFGSYVSNYNYGTWAENYSGVSKSVSILFDLSGDSDEGGFMLFEMGKSQFENALELDLVNVWEFDEATNTIKLRNMLHA